MRLARNINASIIVWPDYISGWHDGNLKVEVKCGDIKCIPGLYVSDTCYMSVYKRHLCVDVRLGNG
jgi:hypothetical protein